MRRLCRLCPQVGASVGVPPPRRSASFGPAALARRACPVPLHGRCPRFVCLSLRRTRRKERVSPLLGDKGPARPPGPALRRGPPRQRCGSGRTPRGCAGASRRGRVSALRGRAGAKAVAPPAQLLPPLAARLCSAPAPGGSCAARRRAPPARWLRGPAPKPLPAGTARTWLTRLHRREKNARRAAVDGAPVPGVSLMRGVSVVRVRYTM